MGAGTELIEDVIVSLLTRLKQETETDPFSVSQVTFPHKYIKCMLIGYISYSFDIKVSLLCHS